MSNKLKQKQIYKFTYFFISFLPDNIYSIIQQKETHKELVKYNRKLYKKMRAQKSNNRSAVVNIKERSQSVREFTNIQYSLQTNSIARLTKQRLPNKKHCPQDEACQHCCQCWLKHKAQYEKRVKFFQHKIRELVVESQLLKKSIERLIKENTELANFKQNNFSIEKMKENLTNELKKQIDEELRIKIIIQKQKIQHLNEEVKCKDEQLRVISSEVNKLQANIKLMESKQKQLGQQITKLQSKVNVQYHKNQQLQIQNKTLSQQNHQMQTRIQSLTQSINQKTQSISKLQTTIGHSQKILSRQTSSVAEKDFQARKLTNETEYKSKIIDSMTKVQNGHRRNISLLTQEKGKLNSLVSSLIGQLQQTDRHKQVLQLALNEAEHLVHSKSLSLQNLKFQVSQLNTKKSTQLQGEIFTGNEVNLLKQKQTQHNNKMMDFQGALTSVTAWMVIYQTYQCISLKGIS